MTALLSVTLACSCQAVLSQDFPVQPSALQGAASNGGMMHQSL